MSLAKNMYMSAKMFKHISEYAFDQTCVEKPEDERRCIQQKYRELLNDIEDDDPKTQKEMDELWSSQWEDRPEYLIPFIVNASFACELYLKAILTHENISYPARSRDGHDLEKLFSALPTESKSSIASSFQFESDDEFREKLHQIRYAFEEWRYWFEGKDTQASCLFIGSLCESLDSYASSLIQQGSVIKDIKRC